MRALSGNMRSGLPGGCGEENVKDDSGCVLTPLSHIAGPAYALLPEVGLGLELSSDVA